MRQAQQDEDRKRIAQASVQAADTFELGQDPLASLTGQQDIFSAAQQEGLRFSRGAGRFSSISVPAATARWLGFDASMTLRADLRALANRHPEYYSSPSEVQADIDFVLAKPDNWYIHDADKVMLFREGEGNQVPQVRLELERSASGMVVRSVYVGNRRQIAKKMADKRRELMRIGLGGQSLDSLTVAEYLEALGDGSSRPESSSDNSPDTQADGNPAADNGQARFGRTMGTTGTLTQPAAQAVVDVIKARWAKAPEVVVVQSMQDERVADALDAMVRSQTTIMHPELGEIRVGRAGQRKTASEGRDPAKLLIAADIENIPPPKHLRGQSAIPRPERTGQRQVAGARGGGPKQSGSRVHAARAGRWTLVLQRSCG